MNAAAKELLEGGLGDYRLKSFTWSEDGNDVILVMLPPRETAKKLRIRFVWATNVRINLDFGPYSGLPLLFECDVGAEDAAGTYSVHFQFGGAPNGEIRLDCNDAAVSLTKEEPVTRV